MTEANVKPRRAFCSWCGEDLGPAAPGSSSRDLESCGQAECNREVRGMARERDDDARERAEADGYSRYGGGW